MATFAPEEQIDFLLKKIVNSKAKGGTSDSTAPSAETKFTHLSTLAKYIWKDNLPTNAPSTNTAPVTVFKLDGAGSDAANSSQTPLELTGVSASGSMTGNSGFYRQWAAIDGNGDPMENWIGGLGGNATWFVRVFIGPTGWGGESANVGTEAQVDAGTKEVFEVLENASGRFWFFDFDAGTLYWANENGETPGGSNELGESVNWSTLDDATYKVYIVGWQYTGAFGVGSSTFSYNDLTDVPATFTPSAHNQAFSTITSTPTTLAGYGITDAFSGSYSDLSNVPATFAPAAHNQAFSTITSTPTTLAGYGITDAFSGSYSDLSNVPATFTPAAHNQAFSTITSTPTTLAGYGITDAFSGSYSDLSNVPATFTPAAHNQAFSTITSTPTTLAGYGITDAFSGSYSDLSNVPATFTPAAHTQAFSTITSTPTTLAGYGITDAFSGNYSDLSGTPSLGTISSQDNDSVDIDGGAIDGTAIGGSTAAAGTFTTLQVNSNATITGNLTVAGDFISQEATIVTFRDTFLDINVAATASDYTTNSGFRFGRSTNAADTLDEMATFTYYPAGDVAGEDYTDGTTVFSDFGAFRFTRHKDSSTGDVASADNVLSLKFNKSDNCVQADQTDGATTMADDDEANATVDRSLGAIAKARITITNTAENGDTGTTPNTNYAPDTAAANGYPIRHNLATQSVYVIAIKDPAGTPTPVYCKYEPIDNAHVRVTVGTTSEGEVYDIIVIG